MYRIRAKNMSCGTYQQFLHKLRVCGIFQPGKIQVIKRCVVLSYSVMSNLRGPRTVAHQAPLSMELFQARTPQWVAISISPALGIEPSSRVFCPGRQILYHLRHQMGWVRSYQVATCQTDGSTLSPS